MNELKCNGCPNNTPELCPYENDGRGKCLNRNQEPQEQAEPDKPTAAKWARTHEFDIALEINEAMRLGRVRGMLGLVDIHYGADSLFCKTEYMGKIYQIQIMEALRK
jgi:hypothetical protein